MIRAAGLLLATLSAGPPDAAPVPADTLAARCAPGFAAPGRAVGDPWADELRIREAAGEEGIPPGTGTPSRGGALAARGGSADCPAAFRLQPLALTTAYRSEYPGRDRDGPLWAGRGWSGMLEGGATFRWRRLSAAVRPQVTTAENRDFVHAQVGLPGLSVFIHPWHPTQIDWPLRHGDRSFSEVHPGESYLRYDFDRIAVGISTERLAWGPARRNPVVLGGGGPGFPHLFAGTAEPLAVPGGDVEAEAVWGRVSESDHFFDEPQYEHRLFGGLLARFRPSFAEGLEVGLTHAHVENRDPLASGGIANLFNPFVPRSRELGRLDRLQLGSVFFRYVLPERGTEIYGEWGRRDLWADALRLKTLTRGDAGFAFGFQHVWTREGERISRVRAHGELTSLRTTRALLDGGRPTSFYVHSRVRHGFTHRGRVLGAPIGPGSDAQALGADVFFGERARVGLMVERVRTDDDAYLRVWARFFSFRGHDVEQTLALPFALRWDPLEVRGTVAHSWRTSRHFTGLFRGAGTGDVLKERNGSLRLQLVWHP